MHDTWSARWRNARVAKASAWSWAVIPLVLAGELAAVLVFVSLLPRPGAGPAHSIALDTAPPVATKTAPVPPAKKRRKDVAETKPGAAPEVGSKPLELARTDAADAGQAEAGAAPEATTPAPVALPQATSGSAPDDAAPGVLGTWLGVRACPGAEDSRIALKITRQGALVHSYSGPASAPLSPGCFSARWNYNPDRTFLEIFPQAWVWRVGQASTLKISGWVSGTVFVAEIADAAGCQGLTLHKQEAGSFPADCN